MQEECFQFLTTEEGVAHSCYLHCHPIFAVKFRRKGTIKQKIHEISETFEVEIIAIALN